MKRQILSALIWAIIAVGGSACDNSWSKPDTPEAVAEKFAELYPAVEKAAWEEKQGNYEADFVVSGRERSAVFNVKGELIEFTEETEEQYLPDRVLKVIQKQFTAYNIVEVFRKQKHRESIYIIKLQKEDHVIVLNFS